MTVSGISTAIAVAAGYQHTCALLSGSNRAVLGGQSLWGARQRHEFDQLHACRRQRHFHGDRDIKRRLPQLRSFEHGTVQCWGYGVTVSLGNGAFSSSNIPVTVTGISTATAISSGSSAYHNCVLLSGAGPQCWGWNYDGALGNGGGGNSNVPVAVGGVSNVTTMAEGTYHTCALISGGTIQCWGYNGGGEFGNGTTTSPTCACPGLWNF